MGACWSTKQDDDASKRDKKQKASSNGGQVTGSDNRKKTRSGSKDETASGDTHREGSNPLELSARSSTRSLKFKEKRPPPINTK